MDLYEHYFLHEMASLGQYAQSQVYEVSQALLLNIVSAYGILIVALIVIGGVRLVAGRRTSSGKEKGDHGNTPRRTQAQEIPNRCTAYQAPLIGFSGLSSAYDNEEAHMSRSSIPLYPANLHQSIAKRSNVNRSVSSLIDTFDPFELKIRN